MSCEDPLLYSRDVPAKIYSPAREHSWLENPQNHKTKDIYIYSLSTFHRYAGWRECNASCTLETTLALANKDFIHLQKVKSHMVTPLKESGSKGLLKSHWRQLPSWWYSIFLTEMKYGWATEPQMCKENSTRYWTKKEVSKTWHYTMLLTLTLHHAVDTGIPGHPGRPLAKEKTWQFDFVIRHDTRCFKHISITISRY